MRRILIVVVLLLSATAGSAQKKSAAPAKPAAGLPSPALVNAFMRRMFGWDRALNWAVVSIQPSEIPGMAEVTVAVGSAQNLTHFYVTADGKHAVVGDVIPFGPDPFLAARELLARKAQGPVRGPAAAPVTVVEFGDLQCPHCKEAQPTLERLLTDLPDTRLVFEEFPLPMHDWALQAAEFAECVHQQKAGAFWKFLQGVYDDQEKITADNAAQRLRQLVTAAGADPDQAAACAQTPAAFIRVNNAIQLGKALGVAGTPTIFLNGRKISNLGSMPYDQLKAMVEFEAEMAPKPPAR